jgi:hypothetical protein
LARCFKKHTELPKRRNAKHLQSGTRQVACSKTQKIRNRKLEIKNTPETSACFGLWTKFAKYNINIKCDERSALPFFEEVERCIYI